jgi:regulator of PEP synthase PpsR (kinase-PPPase family)
VTQFHLHLVSDSTGETLSTIVRAATVQFETADPQVHMWPFVQTIDQLDDVIGQIDLTNGIVLFTLVQDELRRRLEEACRAIQVPCVSVLDPVILALGSYLGAEMRHDPGRQHAMDAEYFARIEAMHFAMAHDDGQHVEELDKADVVLLGVSRTSKTPTCIYLANRGIKAANVPVVPGMKLPAALETLEGPLVVGLTANPKRIVEIRRNRLLSLRQEPETDYVDPDNVKAEVAEARRICDRKGWPLIDVSRRSIEETAAAVLALYVRRSEA